MATYSRTTSNTSSDTQSSNLPAVREPVKSMELGQIIVHSLEVVSEALENKDVPVNAEQITKSVMDGVNKSNTVTKTDLEKSITEAINKSDLAKKGVVPATTSTRQVATTDTQKKEIEKAKQQNPNNNSKNNAALAMQDYWEQKKFADEKKRKDKQDKLENESRKRKEQNYTQQLEQVFSKLNQFSRNPLAGVVNAFEGGVKKFFNKTMNTSLDDVGKHMKKGADIAFAPIKATGQVLGAGAKTTLAVGKGLTKAAVTTTGLVAKGIGGIAKGVGNVVLGGVAVGSLIKDRMLSEEGGAGADLGGLIEGGEFTNKPKNENVKPKNENANAPKNTSAVGKVIECESIICKSIQNGMGNTPEPEENLETPLEEKLDEVVKGVSELHPELANLIEGTGSKVNPELASLIEGGGEEKNKDLAKLLEPDAKDSKKDRKEQKKEQAAQGKILKGLGKGVDMLKMLSIVKFGAIVAAIGGIAVFLPQILGALTPFLNNIPMYLEDLKTKIGLMLSGPNSIGSQIKLALLETIQKIGLSLQNSDDKLLKSLGKGMVSGVASGQQADLAEEFKQSQQYKTMIAQGVSEENMAKFLTAKDSSSLAVKFGEVEKERYNQEITYKNEKGKTKKAKLKDLLLSKQDEVFNDERGMELSNKYKAVVTATSTEDIEENKMTDKEWHEFQDYLWNAKIGTSAISDIQKIYNDKLATAEWLKVVETRESGALVTDFNAQREENKAKAIDLENQRNAEWRIKKAEQGGISLLDFQTDTAWDTNPYLKDIKEEMMSKYATELSKGEKLGLKAMETTAAGKKLVGNLGANITGHSNSWQNAEQTLETKFVVSTTGSESGDITRR